MALPPRHRLPPHSDRSPVHSDVVIEDLKREPELRLIALGEKPYRVMELDDAHLREVEDQLRRARMYEVLTINEAARRMELDELRRRAAQQQARELDRRQQQVVTATMLRQRALAALQAEVEAVRLEREERLAADRRAILAREKERLLERRRIFEATQAVVNGSTSPSVRSGTPLRPGTADTIGGPPVLVMTVALGDGKEDKLIVRQNDDPKRVAATFARKHKLPEHAVHALQQQIKHHVAASAQRHTPSRSRESGEPAHLSRSSSRRSTRSHIGL